MTRRAFFPPEGWRIRSAGRAIFGQRGPSSRSQSCHRREALRLVGSEIALLFGECFDVEGASLLVLADEGEPRLRIGRSLGLSLSVEIDSETGCYVLDAFGGDGDAVLVTTSRERLIDFVVSEVTRVRQELSPLTADAAADILVGRSLDDLERRFVLRTVRRFRGNFGRAADVLRLPVEVLRAKVRAFLHGSSPVPPALGDRP